MNLNQAVRNPIDHPGAIVLAAGRSTRMGTETPKVLLPWSGGRTVIEQIVGQLLAAGIAGDRITVVTGHHAAEVAALVRGMGAVVVYNPDYARGELLSSLKVGLQAQSDAIPAALVVMGDQPELEIATVRQVVAAYTAGHGQIIAPVYQGQRGHPVLFDRRFWSDLLALPAGSMPRTVIAAHPAYFYPVEVASTSILYDIDTPEAYQAARRRAGLIP